MAANPNDWVGASLSGGRYRVDAKLGEGGMGFVYKAWDRNLDTDLVVKVPRRAMLEDAEFAGRFAREIRSLVKLSHPNIVKVSDVGEHDGLPFAVMQFLPGGDLEGRQGRARDGSIRPSHPSTLAGWLPGVAAALDFIHREKYIHRDVKPANILFDAHGHAFLSDFGVAKVLGDSEASAHRGGSVTGAGIVLGTPEYMAPELVMGDPFDGRIDQYALAATAYEMLCGRQAFAGETATAILVRQAHQPPPALIELAGPGSREIARAVLRGLAKDPAARFASCGDFARALVEAAALAGVAPPVVIPEKLACPLCGRLSPMPAAVLADPAKVAGRKTACPGCKAPLQFADDGLSLVVPGGSPRAPGATMPIETPGRGATVAVAPGSRTTMKVGAVAAGPRMAETEAMLPIATAEPARETSAPARKRTPNPVLVSAAMATLSLVGIAMAFALTRQPAAPVAIAVARNPGAIRTPAPRPIGPKAPAAPAPAATLAPEPGPAVAESKPAASPPPPPSPAPAIATTPPSAGPVRAMVATSGTGPRPASAEPPADASPADDTPVLDLSLKQLVEDPGACLGRVVVPADLVQVDTRMGFRRQVSVASRTGKVGRDGRAVGENFKIALAPGVANHLDELILGRKVHHGVYFAILNIRVARDPGHSDAFLGMVERLEFLWMMSPSQVALGHYHKAFQVITLTNSEVDPPHLGEAKPWEARFGGKFLNHVKLQYRAMKAQQRDQQFAQMESQVARSTAEMQRMASQVQKQQADLLKSWANLK